MPEVLGQQVQLILIDLVNWNFLTITKAQLQKNSTFDHFQVISKKQYLDPQSHTFT